MGLSIHTQGQLCRIGVLGHLDSAESQMELLRLLEGMDNSMHIQLDFYDADTLPVSIVEAICRLLDATQSLKISSYQNLLTHSLMRIGIPVRQVWNSQRATKTKPYKVLALGGSANSLDKMIRIITNLPQADIHVFVVQHVPENQQNLLDQLLRACTDYQVLMPHHMMPLETRTIYVAPPGHHMKIAHGQIYLTRDRLIQYARPSIDALFHSVAHEFGERVLAVLLCGYGRDGVAGCASLKQAGACVIAEDGCECADARILPDTAQQEGVCDLVLKLPAISSMIAAGMLPLDAALTPHSLELFAEAIWSHYYFDFRAYQHDSLMRRLSNTMTRWRVAGFFELQRAIFCDAALFDRMLAEVSVGVSAFFRHPEQCKIIREEILPYIDSFPVIKIWSAGCAGGEEAYSFGMMLHEANMHRKSRLFATDFNSYLIDLAKNGLFPLKCLENSRDNYQRSGGHKQFDDFVQVGTRYFSVAEHLHGNVLFHRHSLIDEGVFNEFQMIVCRNVMIYFNSDMQRQVLERFAQSLHRDGFLVLGPQDGLDQLVRATGFIPYMRASHIYRLSEGQQR
jgi:chemotaxis protein methyltransferase CheR